MSPCKGGDGNVESGRKEEGVTEEGVCHLTNSLTHLSLKDNLKDIIQLEHHLASIKLQDTQEVKDLEECKIQEEEDREEKQDETDEEKEKQDLNDEAESETKGKEEDTEEEEPEDVKEKETEETEVKKNIDDKAELARDKTKVEEDDEEEKRDEEEKEDEKKNKDEESDDENPTDEENKSNEALTKTTRFRSRGIGTNVCHGYSPRPYMEYPGASAYQHQPCQMSPQHYNGVESESGALNSSCYEADSPGYYEDNRYICSSPQYQNQSSPYYKGLANTPQAQDSPYYQHQDSPYYQHQDSPYYQHQDSPYYQHQDSPQSLYRHHDSPLYQQQDSPKSLYQAQDSPHPLYQHQDSSPMHHYSYRPPQYSELVFQDSSSSVSTPYSSMNSSSSSSSSSSSLGQNSFPQSLLTPPVSPQPTSTLPPKPAGPLVGEFICSVINSVMQQGDVSMSPHDRNIIEIKKNLLDIGNCPSDNIEDDLNEITYEIYYKEFAKMENEVLVNPDDDGDILYVKAACTDQFSKDYKEKLVAFTKRVEMMDLCCDRIVNWKEKRCQKCGAKDPQLFYSPLSWKNKYDQMLLSNLVQLQFPLPVVEYITRKVMCRPMDLKRTFIQHREFLSNHAELYPCLKEGLRKLQ